MAKLIVSFFCLAVLSAAVALDCYNCMTKMANDKTCADLASVPTVTCGKTVGDFKPACLKSIFKDKTTGAVNTTRKCVILPKNGDAKAECVPPQNQDLVFCEPCYDNQCNGSPVTNVNVYTLMAAALSVLFAKFVLH